MYLIGSISADVLIQFAIKKDCPGLDFIYFGNKDKIGDFMPIPKEVQDLYNDPAAIKVLATRSGEDLHVIPLGSMRVLDANTIICATIHMREAHENLHTAAETGARISTLAVKTGQGGPPQAYQVRCRVKDFVTTGPIFEEMQDALKKRGMEVRGVWILEPLEVLAQIGPNAGKKIA